MGNARWSDQDWARYSNQTQQKSQEQIFRQRGLHPDLDPSQFKVRECVDSPANPEATPIILGCDETGSMGSLAELLIKQGLGKIMRAIYDHKPVPDPQILCMGLGDANCDHAPLQMTQFEASVDPLTAQVEKIYLEGNGGGNGGETYPFAWWGANFKTVCDAIIKRKRRGYLFTIGDECPHPQLRKEHVRQFGGVGCESDVGARDLLTLTQQFWHVFHLIVKPVADQPVVTTWQSYLHERAISVPDEDKIPEIIVAIIRLIEGQKDVERDYDKGTALVVHQATRQLAGV